MPLAAGARVRLPESVARHVQVLRLQPGDAIALFCGDSDEEWHATIAAMGRRDVDVQVGAPRRIDRELPWPVTLALAPPTNDRMDALVEKAGELGAAAIQPLVCARSVMRLSGERAEARRRHWSGVAAAASEQCGRTRVTEVRPVRPFADWLADLVDDGSGRVVLSLAAGAAPAATVFAGRRPGAAWTVLSGPEGGLDADEEALAIAHGFQPTSLGPRVLRADSAPLAVLAWLALQN